MILNYKKEILNLQYFDFSFKEENLNINLNLNNFFKKIFKKKYYYNYIFTVLKEYFYNQNEFFFIKLIIKWSKLNEKYLFNFINFLNKFFLNNFENNLNFLIYFLNFYLNLLKDLYLPIITEYSLTILTFINKDISFLNLLNNKNFINIIYYCLNILILNLFNYNYININEFFNIFCFYLESPFLNLNIISLYGILICSKINSTEFLIKLISLLLFSKIISFLFENNNKELQNLSIQIIYLFSFEKDERIFLYLIKKNIFKILNFQNRNIIFLNYLLKIFKNLINYSNYIIDFIIKENFFENIYLIFQNNSFKLKKNCFKIYYNFFYKNQ